MILNKWKESIIVKGKSSKGKVLVQIVNECTELYEVCKQSVKNGCSIKNRKTRSCYNLGYLDYDKNTKPFKHDPKEYNKWCTLIRKYVRTGVQCEKFCSYVEFLKVLREHPLYDEIMNNDGVVIVATEDGEIKVNKRHNYSKDMVVRINTRTNKATVYNSLEEVAESIGFGIDYLRKVIGTNILVKGSRLEWL